MNQVIEPNSPQGDLPDLDLPGEEPGSRQIGDRPRARSWLPKIVVLLVIAALGVVVTKYFIFAGGADEATVPATPSTGKFALPTTNGAALPIASKKIAPAASGPALPQAVSPQQLEPQNRILLLEKKLDQFTQDARTRMESLEKAQKEMKDLGQGGGEIQAAIKQFSDNLEALKQKMGGWETQLQTKATEQAAAATKLEERVAGVETGVGELKKQQDKEREARQNLPFKMLSVDMWNGKPYVAVSLAEKVSLITVGDVVMGWKVASIDFDGGKAVFVKNGKRIEQTTER